MARLAHFEWKLAPGTQAEWLATQGRVFVGSDADVRRVAAEAGEVAATLRGGGRLAGFWMLWGSEFATDWAGAGVTSWP